MKVKWTDSDEQLLQALLDQKAYFEKTTRTAIDNIMQGFVTDSSLRYELITFMVNNADAIRDALEPYDSGVRPPNAG